MTYFTDNVYEKMMIQKPQYSSASAKSRPPKKEQKIRKLIVVHEKVEATKQDKEGYKYAVSDCRKAERCTKYR